MIRSSFVPRALRCLLSVWFLKRAAFALAAMITVIVLALAVENWRNRRALNAYVAEWEAKGERFDPAALIPSKVPDDQNFAMTPLLAPNFRPGQPHGTNRITPRTTLPQLSLTRMRTDYLPGGPTNQATGNFARGRRNDLRAWQDYYRAPTQPAGAGHDDPERRYGLSATATAGNPSMRSHADRARPALTNEFPVTAEAQTPARDVLHALRRFESEFRELDSAADRPYAQFPILADQLDVDSVLPRLARAKQIMLVLNLRASAALADGRSDLAFATTKAGLRLCDTVGAEPFLVSHLLALTAQGIMTQPLWEGLADHRWTEPQLEYFQRYLAAIDFFAAFRRAVRWERAVFQIMPMMTQPAIASPTELSPNEAPSAQLQKMQKTFGRMPKGWIYQNQLALYRLYQTAIDCQPGQSGTPIEFLAQSLRTNRTVYNVLAGLLAPAFHQAAVRSERAQAYVNLAMLGCALERFRLRHARYPSTLEALEPTYVSQVPKDFMSGSALCYRLLEDGRILLYSVGPDRHDDGGKFQTSPRGQGETTSGFDWVWTYPPQ